MRVRVSPRPPKRNFMRNEIEANPFADEQVAKQWAASVEGESGLWRDTALYPAMRAWVESIAAERPTILDLGSGQGRSSSEIEGYEKYIGVEPSTFLVDRAKALYARPDREFVLGDAYDIPLPDASVDGVVCVNVLFHLANVEGAIQEMSRVLRPGGSFFVNTADNDAVEMWKTLYTDLVVNETMMQGALRTPATGLSLNTFYFQPNDSVFAAFERHGLHIDRVTKTCEKGGKTLFMAIEGKKSSL